MFDLSEIEGFIEHPKEQLEKVNKFIRTDPDNG